MGGPGQAPVLIGHVGFLDPALCGGLTHWQRLVSLPLEITSMAETCGINHGSNIKYIIDIQ